ncbi:MAG: ATP-dependent protease subunit HslV [Cetobacterium sp.]|uniref:ATP-dependent protease subunit HslV n=1 Tax=unclassified Cetobacterium TaxID=2630983 RepID=UPI00163CA4A8|nr:ATP-dependent protease subunit HslV [Cetobacterium sp. 2A]MBC2855830.1 ATP-dependent protease subunit HslV [Cetobacterium sp. 2A]
MERMRATTIIAVRRNNEVAIAGDGQVTFGDTVFKNTARKIRKIPNYNIVAGFAGGAADALALFEKFENKLDEFGGNLKKASVELAKEWRNDKALRFLEAMLLVADKNIMLLLSGNGDVIEVEEGIAAIGSGGTYAYSAGKALLEYTSMSASEIAVAAMGVAGEICIYTNLKISVETL